MADATVAVDLDQALDVLADLLAQLAFDGEVLVDEVADAVDLVVGQVADLGVRGDAGLGADLLRGGAADAVDVAERHVDLLVARNVDTRDTGHADLLPLPLLVAGVRADNANDAFTAHDLALFTALFD